MRYTNSANAQQAQDKCEEMDMGCDAPIYPPKPSLDFMVGMVFRDTRPESLQKVRANLKKSRRLLREKHIAIPERIYVRVIQVAPTFVRIISVEDPFAKHIKMPFSEATDLVAMMPPWEVREAASIPRECRDVEIMTAMGYKFLGSRWMATSTTLSRAGYGLIARESKKT